MHGFYIRILLYLRSPTKINGVPSEVAQADLDPKNRDGAVDTMIL